MTIKEVNSVQDYYLAMLRVDDFPDRYVILAHGSAKVPEGI
jgi:hypothetical protein